MDAITALSRAVRNIDARLRDLANREPKVRVLKLPEVVDPGPADANQGWIFTRDNGAGKTQVCVRFPTGAVQVLATEP